MQLTGILLWVGVLDGGIVALQGTNFGVLTDNSFIRTFGIQFIILLFIISVFFFLVIATLRLTHNPTAVLIRRKRIIFPVRICHLCYNMLLFSTLASITNIRDLSRIDIF